MNKIDYLNALKEALKHVDIKVMEDIVADYEEHFQVGLEEGKSEEQICEELGSIEDLVREINEVYQTGNQKAKADAGEDAANKQERPFTAQDKWYYTANGDRITNTINRVLDTTSNAISNALTAAGEAISKVDVKDLGDRLKSSVDRAASHLSKLDTYMIMHPELSGVKPERFHENTSNSYSPSGDGSQKMDLVVDGLCADIHVMDSQDDKITVRYENDGNDRQRQKYAFYSFMQGNTVYAGIHLMMNQALLFNFKAYSMTIYLEIPRGLGVVDIKTANGDIKGMNVTSGQLFTETASGDLSLTRIGTDSLVVKSASGDIKIEDCNSLHTSIETLSGDIQAKYATARELSLKTASGDITAEHTQADKIDYITLSGDLDLKHLKAGECKIKSTSGDLQINNSALNSADIGSTSGDIHLSNTAGETLSVKSISGDLELDVNVRRCWADTKSGDVHAAFNGDVTLEAASTSGSLQIGLKNFNNGYSIQSKTVSGSLSVHYNNMHQRNLKTGTYTFGNQGSSLSLRSVSGNIQVKD